MKSRLPRARTLRAALFYSITTRTKRRLASVTKIIYSALISRVRGKKERSVHLSRVRFNELALKLSLDSSVLRVKEKKIFLDTFQQLHHAAAPSQLDHAHRQAVPSPPTRVCAIRPQIPSISNSSLLPFSHGWSANTPRATRDEGRKGRGSSHRGVIQTFEKGRGEGKREGVFATSINCHKRIMNVIISVSHRDTPHALEMYA